MEAARLQSDTASNEAANQNDEEQATFADVQLGYVGILPTARPKAEDVANCFAAAFQCCCSLAFQSVCERYTLPLRPCR